MKKFSLLIFAFIAFLAGAQAPAGYYDSANGLSGAALKTALSKIITQGHRDNGYGGLWTGYKTTDIDNFYEKDGTVLDIYSENPNGPDPYNYMPGQKQCGNYSGEGDCYNREHIVPQSLFNSASPMYGDINFIRPTDGKVNGMRSNYPFGKVGSATFTSKNGSKLGSSVSSGYGGTVFEPIDAFKGDVARMIFYFVTRYESQLSTFKSGDMLGGNAFPGLQTWELNQLMAWSIADPVSAEEVARNNASYTFQGNRNPFIDHPEYVQMIWGTPVADTTPPTAATNLAASNPTSNSVTLNWTAATDNIGVATYDIYVDGVLKTSVSGTATSAVVTGLNANTTYNFYIIAKDAAGNASPASNTVSATTNNAPPAATNCVSEDFETISGAPNAYTNNTWTSNGVTWTATDSRVDQTINGKAITIRNGALSASTSPNGIGSLTVTTQLKFSGSAGNFILTVNGNEVGRIPYSETVTTTTIPNINIAGNVDIVLKNNSTTNRPAIDDLSWTCFTNLGTADEANVKNAFKVYPNPVRNGEMKLTGLKGKTDVEIYTTSGQKIQTIKNVENNQNIPLRKLPKGIYLIKAENQATKMIVD